MTLCGVLTKISENIISGRMSLREYVAEILQDNAKNYETPTDFVQRVSYFFGLRILDETTELDSEGRRCVLAATRLEEIPADRWLRGVLNDKIRLIIQLLLDVNVGDAGVVPSFEQEVERKGWRKKFNLHLRKLVTGGSPGPGLSETMCLLGRDVVLARISDLADRCIQTRNRRDEVLFRQLVPQHRHKELQ